MADSTDLYVILGVDKTARQTDIVRAFRLRALQLHPDKKRTETEREAATSDFQALQAAYEVLRDPEKRSRYDATGDVSESLQDAVARWSGARPRVTRDEITEFEKKYKGSREEEEDIVEFCIRFKGDVSKLFEFIPCSEPNDVERYISLIKRLIKEKRVSAGDCNIEAFQASVLHLRKAAKRYARRQKKEKAEIEASAGETSLEDISTEKSGSQDALILAIQANKRRRENDLFLENLEKKYGKVKNISRGLRKKHHNT